MTNLKIQMKYLKILSLITLVLTFVSCGRGDFLGGEFTLKNNAIEMVGVIDVKTSGRLQAALDANPTIKTIRLTRVPGSLDDESSIGALPDLLRSHQLTTVVPSNGLVASGGTDLFLMGVNRIIEPGACVGVHSWADGSVFSFIFSLIGIDSLKEGKEFPKDSPAHKLYLDFYNKIGISQDFYWFTLEVASASDIYWMSPEEINRFNLTTAPVSFNETKKERDQRCSDRLSSPEAN